MSNYKYVIVGGGIAGQRAGDGIRRVDPDGSVALITDEPHMPYQRPPLSKGYLTGREGLEQLYLKEQDYYADNQIEVINDSPVERLDPAAHTVELASGENLSYEKLLLATGGRAWRLPIDGGTLPGVFTLRRIEDADGIRQAARRGGRALVLGGGFMGAETASSLAQIGTQVAMAFPESRLLERVLPEELSALLHARYQAEGVRVLPGTLSEALEGDGWVQRARLSNGETLDIDLVVMGVGIRLNTELAQDAGLEMGPKGAVVVDAHLRTSEPSIYAAGDIAAWPDSTFGKRLRSEHWDVARRQGIRAGRNMAGQERRYVSLPYFSCGRPDEERKPLQALIKARARLDDLAARLGDEGVDLATLVG